MFDELVEALRLCVKYGKAEDSLANAQKAADAIEELSKQVEKWEEIADIWRSAYAGLERRMYPKPPKEKE